MTTTSGIQYEATPPPVAPRHVVAADPAGDDIIVVEIIDGRARIIDGPRS